MRFQRGGFLLGMVVGLLIGLALALGVALYVTKVPVPFVDKVPQRTAEQDAAEAERNKRWDPNAPLAGKPAQRPEAASAPPAGASAAVATPTTARAAPVEPAAPKPARDPAAILAGAPATAPASAASSARSTAAAGETLSYFVQVGAYSQGEDAEAQRAKLAMLGYAAKVTEREQSGRIVYRVRLGPYDKKELADATQEKLRASAIESALVRVER